MAESIVSVKATEQYEKDYREYGLYVDSFIK